MCPRMQVQFEGGDKTRAGSINIATLPRSYMHGLPMSTNVKSARERDK